MSAIKAWAKINVGLWVGSADETGLHPIRSRLVELDLADDLTLAPVGPMPLAVHADPVLPAALRPGPGGNLVSRAAELVKDVLGPVPCHPVALYKRIPAGAGLGGGSADAAAYLRAVLAERSAREQEAVWSRVQDLGRDIPFFRRGGVQLVEGYGERLTPLDGPQTPLWVLLANPGFSLSTADVYRAFDALGSSRTMPDSELWRDFSNPDLLQNDLEPAAFRVNPNLRAFKAHLQKLADGRPVWLSGSGATYYILIDDIDQAAWLDRVRSEVPWAVLARRWRREQ